MLIGFNKRPRLVIGVAGKYNELKHVIKKIMSRLNFTTS
jgi:hypothetical protein